MDCARGFVGVRALTADLELGLPGPDPRGAIRTAREDIVAIGAESN